MDRPRRVLDHERRVLDRGRRPRRVDRLRKAMIHNDVSIFFQSKNYGVIRKTSGSVVTIQNSSFFRAVTRSAEPSANLLEA